MYIFQRYTTNKITNKTDPYYLEMLNMKIDTSMNTFKAKFPIISHTCNIIAIEKNLKNIYKNNNKLH